METDGTARRGEEWKTRDRRADSGGWLQSTRCQRVDIREGEMGAPGRHACAGARRRVDDFEGYEVCLDRREGEQKKKFKNKGVMGEGGLA